MSKRVSNKKGKHQGARCHHERVRQDIAIRENDPGMAWPSMHVVRKDLSIFERVKRRLNTFFRPRVR